MDLIVDVTGLSKSYGSVQALDDVDFGLRTGEVMALLGENGAGKSTLVKVLAGLVHPDAGDIRMDGESVTLYPNARSQAAGIAVVHQEYSTIPALSVAENLVIGQPDAPRFWSRRRLHPRARELLELVGLADVDPGRTAETLSVAELQLLELARLLARNARVLIFDEPTAALSDREIDRVMEVIKRLRDEGHSIIYVTHRLPEVFRLADRVTVFRNGRSLEPVPTSDLEIDDVITMMLGREMADMFPERPERLGDETYLVVEDLMAPGLVEPVSLEAHRGEIVGLTGQLGSGASAVIGALAGRIRQESGRVSVDGQLMSEVERRRARGGQIAYCSPDRKRDGIFQGRTTRENLSSPWLRSVVRHGWVLRDDERDLVELIARRFAVDTARLRSKVDNLSGGNQQKVAVGRWLGANPGLMLLEEPTRGVDVGARADIYQRLRDICDEGLTILIATSDTTEVLGLADTVATFYRGRMTASRPREDWTEEALTREVMHSSDTPSAR